MNKKGILLAKLLISIETVVINYFQLTKNNPMLFHIKIILASSKEQKISTKNNELLTNKLNYPISYYNKLNYLLFSS